MSRNRIVLVTLLLAGMSFVAQANAGTPLMWFTIFHLFIGNLIIGLFEGILLVGIFGLAKPKTLVLMVLANYVSAGLGGHIITRAIVNSYTIDLGTVWPMLGRAIIITYLLTLILEFPFVVFAFRGTRAWLSKSILGSLFIQTISYAILIGWYWMAGGPYLYTDTEVVDISKISLPNEVQVYFISDDEGDVYTGELQDRTWQKAFDLKSTNLNERLLVIPSEQDADAWDLVAWLETENRDKPDMVTLQEQFARVATPEWRGTDPEFSRYEGTWSNWGPVPKLGEALSSTWEFYAGMWSGEGLMGREANSGRDVHLALEVPFISWTIRNAMHLPTDMVLFQLGDHQICVYDPDKGQVALLAKGRGPVAVMKDGAADDSHE